MDEIFHAFPDHTGHIAMAFNGEEESRRHCNNALHLRQRRMILQRPSAAGPKRKEIDTLESVIVVHHVLVSKNALDRRKMYTLQLGIVCNPKILNFLQRRQI